MVEVTTSAWQAIGTWTVRSLGQRVPGWLLGLFWTGEKLLERIELFHFDQSPQFQVRNDMLQPILFGGGFNVFNMSPFKYSIVALDLRMSVDSRELYGYALRLPSEIPVQPYSRSGFYYEWPLAGGALTMVQEYPRDDVRVRIQGYIIIKTVFGELRKTVHADILADIDRDARPT